MRRYTNPTNKHHAHFSVYTYMYTYPYMGICAHTHAHTHCTHAHAHALAIGTHARRKTGQTFSRSTSTNPMHRSHVHLNQCVRVTCTRQSFVLRGETESKTHQDWSHFCHHFLRFFIIAVPSWIQT